MNPKPFLLFLPALAIACASVGETKIAPATATLDPEIVEAGRQLFTSIGCSACHGETGRGDGPAAPALDPKPRNYIDAAWQESVTDEWLGQVIRDGGAAHGLSTMMPPSPAMQDDAEGLAALTAFIRSLRE